VIPSQFPPVDIFEGIYDTDEERVLAFAIEGMTNPRLRAEAGDIALVPPGEWLTGPGASPVMAAFTHTGKPSRFTDGSFGVYYAARTLATAIAETSYHRAKFLAATGQPDQEITMRVYSGTLAAPLDDVTLERFSHLLDPDDYSVPQAFAAGRRSGGSDGLLYPSVRDPGGLCVAVFRPKALKLPKQRMHLRYVYSAAARAIRSVLEIKNH
jgi:RES domain-containing protein